MKTIQVLGDGIGAVTLLNVSGDDKGIVRSARISFDQQNDFTELNDKDAKLIKYLLEHHHGSPFEHNLIQYEVTCPIFVDRQFVRHRIGVAKNENSARYSEVKERFYVPNDPRRQATNNRQASVEDTDEAGELKKFGSILYRHAIENAYAVYAELLAMGMTREQARGVLPQSSYTTSIYSFNLRSLLHFIGLRDHEGSQYETQLYAKAMRELAQPHFAATFSAWDELHA